jgi:ATP-dependent protease Clp ATPase subunit
MKKDLFKVKMDTKSIHYVIAGSFSDVEEKIKGRSRGSSSIQSIEILDSTLFIEGLEEFIKAKNEEEKK